MRLTPNETLLAAPEVKSEREYLNPYKELKSRYGDSVVHDTSMGKMLNGDQIDLKTVITDTKPEFDSLVLTTPKHLIYAGLVADEAFSPMDYDGEGEIFRYDFHSERRDFYRALGLDNEGEPELDDMRVAIEAANHAVATVKADKKLLNILAKGLRSRGVHATTERIYQMISEVITGTPWHLAEDAISHVFFDCRYKHHLDEDTQEAAEKLFDAVDQEAFVQAWTRAMKTGSIGVKHALVLDKYEHGGVAYSIAGTGCSESWDTSRNAAVWVPDAAALENIKLIALRNAFEFFKVKSIQSEDVRTYAYTQDEGATWSEPTNCLDQVIEQAIKANQFDFASKWSNVFTKALCNYAASVIEQFNDYINGSAYRTLVYVIDRQTSEHVHDEDCQTILGHDSAYIDLVDTVVATEKSLA